MNLCSVILWSSVTNQKFLIVKRLAIGRATLSQVAHPNTQKKLSNTFERLQWSLKVL
jgi:hypothetical protein